MANVVTLSLAASYAQRVLHEGRGPSGRNEVDPVLAIGAVQSLGLRSLPLITVHINDLFSIDGYAGVEHGFADDSWRETYMLGFTLLW